MSRYTCSSIKSIYAFEEIWIAMRVLWGRINRAFTAGCSTSSHVRAATENLSSCYVYLAVASCVSLAPVGRSSQAFHRRTYFPPSMEESFAVVFIGAS